MTRRERMEHRLEQRREWAQKAQQRSAAHFDTSHTMADRIPFGQPILVGHHSERADRRYRGQIAGHMDRGVEEMKKAAYHEEKADGIETQLGRVVFSDDADAIEQLQARIAESTAEAERLTRYNKAWRKHKTYEGMVADGVPEKVAARAVVTMTDAYSWMKSPFDTSHLRAAIRRDKQRIDDVRTQQTQHDAAAAAGGMMIALHPGTQYVSEQAVVTFAEKPSRDIIDALKAAGFYWASGSWCGKRGELPEEVAALVSVSQRSVG